MAGQIIKKSERTRLVRIYGGRDGEGKRSYKNKTIRGTRKDAEKWLHKQLTAISTGDYFEPSPLTLKEYFAHWTEAALRDHVRPNTFREYMALWQRYIEPVLGSRRLCDLRVVDVQ